jgi:glycosyltransferase involved in cell wall biosynthesis
VRILMVGPYPPMRGGIAAYTGEAVTRLREQGHEVEVASAEPSDAEHVLDLRRPGSGRALARLAKRFDRMIVQFHPEFLAAPDSTLPGRSRAMLRLGQALRAAPRSTLTLHEVNYGAGPLAPALQLLVRPIWKLADELTVHTEREREDFVRAFRIDEDRIKVVSQAEYMQRRLGADRVAARAALGLPADELVLLAIGFLQPNKGFDRAIRAFGSVAPEGTRLYVVGSVWREDAASVEHLAELRRLASETPGAELRDGYVSDEDFDRWIVASDALVLPYRHGWSSNVMERGLLYDRPVVMSRVGGMAEQGADRPGVTLVANDAELAEAVRRTVGDLVP